MTLPPPPSTTKTAVLTEVSGQNYNYELAVNWLDESGEQSNAPTTAGDYKFKINLKGTESKPEGGQAGDWSTLHISAEEGENSGTGGTTTEPAITIISQENIVLAAKKDKDVRFHVNITNISDTSSPNFAWTGANAPGDKPGASIEAAGSGSTHTLILHFETVPGAGTYTFTITLGETVSTGGSLDVTASDAATPKPGLAGDGTAYKESLDAEEAAVTLTTEYEEGSTAKIYDDAEGSKGSLATGVSVTLDGDELVISSTDGETLEPGVYWVTVTAKVDGDDLGESEAVKITVANRPVTPVPSLTYYAKALSGGAAEFTITPSGFYTGETLVSVYEDAEGGKPLVTPTAALSGDTLTLSGGTVGFYYLRFKNGDSYYSTTSAGVSIFAEKTAFYLKFDGDLSNEFSNHGSPVVRTSEGAVASPDFVEDSKFTDTKSLHLSPGQYLDLGDGANYGAGKDFTVAFWVKVNTSAGQTQLGGSTSSYYVPMLGAVNTDGSVAWQYRYRGDGQFAASWASSYSRASEGPDAWWCVYSRFDAANGKVYSYVGQGSAAPTSKSGFNDNHPDGVSFLSLTSGLDIGRLYVGNSYENGAWLSAGASGGVDMYIQNLVIIPGRVELDDIFAGESEMPLSDTPVTTETASAGNGKGGADFTLTNNPAYGEDTVWKVYDSDSASAVSAAVSASVSGSTLTLTNLGAAITSTAYYIEANEPGKEPSARVALTVTLAEVLSLTGVKITIDGTEETSLAMDLTEKVPLAAAVTPDTMALITWTSSAPEVASINAATGELTAYSSGSAIITVSASNFKTAAPVTAALPVTVSGNRLVWGWKFVRDGGVSWSADANSGIAGTIGGSMLAATFVAGNSSTQYRSALNTTDAVSIKGLRYAGRFTIGSNQSTVESSASNAQNSSGVFDFSSTSKKYKVFLTVDFVNSSATKPFMVFVNNNTTTVSKSPLQDCTILSMTAATASSDVTVGAWCNEAHSALESKFFTSTDFTAGADTLSKAYLGLVMSGDSAPETNASALPDVRLKAVRIVEYPVE